MRAFSWCPWIPGTLKLDSILALFKCVFQTNFTHEKAYLEPYSQDIQIVRNVLNKVEYLLAFTDVISLVWFGNFIPKISICTKANP